MSGFMDKIVREIMEGRVRQKRFDKMVADMHYGSGEIQPASTSGKMELRTTRRADREDNSL